jgi:hypothetical protein
MDIRQPTQMDIQRVRDGYGFDRSRQENQCSLISSRPKSVSGLWTGATGVLTALTSAVLLRDWIEVTYIKALAVLALSAVAMVAVDLLVYLVQLNPTTELTDQPIRPLNLPRLFQKLVGFWLTLGVIAALYALLPEYGNAFYQPFKDAVLYLLPGVIVASPFYIAYVDRRQRDPVDAYAQLAVSPPIGAPLPSTPAAGWSRPSSSR